MEIMSNENIGTFPHKVYAYHTKDRFGNISLNKLLPLILDSAGDHAEQLGCGKEELLRKQHTWVLSRINIELDELVADVKTLYIDTWISFVKSAFSVRLFEIHDGKGTRIAYGNTYWSIINTETRRLASIPKIIGEHPVTNARKVPCKMPQKLVFERGELVAQEIAQYTDLDYNGHVNSNRYLDWGINSFSPGFLASHRLAKIELNYTQEVYWEDTVCIYKTESANTFELELYNKTQETTACKMRLHFTPKGQTEK